MTTAADDDDDDPFGLKESDRTQLARPRPGGRGPEPARAAPALGAAPAFGGGGTGAALPPGTPGRGPLVERAFGLLALVPLLRSRTPPAEPGRLRAQIEGELRRFADAAQAAGVDGRLVGTGHYALCALVDDAVLNTPWGAHGDWRSRSLAGTLHGDVAAGERFFDHLEQAGRQPERHRPLLELMAACLALGFEGRYRLAPQGQAALARLRGDLLATLARMDGEAGAAARAELSGRWRGVGAAHVPLARRVPLWVCGTAALALLALVYAAFALRLGGIGERLDALVAALPPAGPVSIARAAAAPPVPPAPRSAALEPTLRACLPEGARARPDAVAEDLQKVRVRLPSAGLFASGSAELRPEVEPVVACLAAALDDAPGRVLVLGHSDNVPIRTARFPSNWELSKARAEAVAGVVREVLGDAGRLEVEGRADSEPVAPNAAEDGRARNRRVEVVLLR